jgi:hypothetical protein
VSIMRKFAAAGALTLSLVAPAALTSPGAQAAPATEAGVLASGYVTEGNLRPNPNLGNTPILTIFNQWVQINCWIDGGNNGFGSNRWFEATYYGKTGYLSSGVVSSQPAVGHC